MYVTSRDTASIYPEDHLNRSVSRDSRDVQRYMIRRLRKPAPYQSSFCLLLRGSAHPFTPPHHLVNSAFCQFRSDARATSALTRAVRDCADIPQHRPALLLQSPDAMPSVRGCAVGDFIHI